jgi:Family of unknown function (DUF6941)
MVPLPTVVGLIVCERVIVEEGTKNVSLISTFERLNVEGMPSTPRPFAVFTTLTDGQGHGTIELVISNLESAQEVYVRRMPVHFSDRLTDLRVLFQVNRCSFPAGGWYQLSLLIDGELLGSRKLRVTVK